MSLHRQNNTHDKNNARLWILSVGVCLLLCVLFIGGVSFARYVGDWNGRLDADVAQWKMQINGVSLADTAAASKITVAFVPVKDGVASPSKKIEPGQSGYFDIVIDPEGTETSFSYSIKVDLAQSKLPDGMRIDGYSLNGGVSKEKDFAAGEERVVQNDITLPDAGIFGADDKITVRFFWTWKDVAFDEFAEYNVVVTAVVTQYCGGDARSESAKRGQTP